MVRSQHPADVPIAHASHLSACVDCLELLGVPTSAALERAHLPQGELPPGAMLPVYAILRFCGDVARREGIPDLGLRVASARDSSVLTPQLRARLAAAPSLHAALRGFVELTRELSSHVAVTTVARGGRLWVRLGGSTRPDVLGADLSEHHRLALVVQLVRAYLGSGWCPDEVHLETGSPPPAALEAFLGGGRVVCGMPWGAVSVPTRLLATPPPEPRVIGETGGADPEAPLLPGEMHSWVQRLARVLPAYLAEGALSVELVGEMLCVCPRTLQRRLKASGLTYSELLERVRYAEARRLLAEPDLPVRAVAARLGYGHRENFNRAVRRMAGCSPSELRRTLTV